MFISLPWDAVQPVEPTLPDEPFTPATLNSTTHLSPFNDPASPKYNVPAVIFVGSVGGLAVLTGLLVLLWKLRMKLIARWGPLPKWMCRCISAAQRLSFPMPAAVYLCGWLRASSPGPSPSSGSPPPPYNSQTSGPPALPPGLLPPRSAAAPACTRPGPAPSPPPTYPPAPPPTPDDDAAASSTAASSSISSTTPAAFDPFARAAAPAASFVPSRPPPAALAVPGRSTLRSVRSMYVTPAPSPPPAYPPPPLPDSRHKAQEVCTVPWGSVEASTPYSSSVLASCRAEA